MQIGRSFTGQDHDHITVVVEAEKVLHIGPPKVRLLPLHRVMEPRREPRVLRIAHFSGQFFAIIITVNSALSCQTDVHCCM